MKVERHKNFLSPEECAELNAWVDEATEKNWLDAGIDGNGGVFDKRKRVTSRFYGGRFEYPQLALDISKRARSFYGINSCGLVRGGRDGIVVSNIFNGGHIYEHVDKDPTLGLSILRLNIMTRKPISGGVLHVCGEPVDVEVGELHSYLADELPHKVSEVVGDVFRVMWIFGAYVPAADWHSGAIKAGAN